MTERNGSANEADVICGRMEAECMCSLAASHDGYHSCQCGGEWRGSTADNTFEVVSFPGIFGALMGRPS